MKKIEFIKISTSRLLVVCITVLCLPSCDFFKIKTEEEGNEKTLVASVGNTHLYLTDIDHISQEIQSELDSAELVSRYVQSWVKKQLVIREAGKNLTINEAEINRKLLDYRYALIAYEYEKSFVEETLDKNVTASEIQNYYDQNRGNFALKEIIIRTNFVKVEKNLPQKRQLERLLGTSQDGSTEELKDFAIRYANNYFIEDSTWIKFQDIIINTPLSQNSNHVQLLQNDDLISVDDDNFSYYFKILEYRLQDQVPPLEFVRDEISKIIVNKRRVEIAEKLKRDIYNKALDNNEFTIYE
ncbi:MAG: peptidyl-prolyl cis-trans isomerase [Cyclobacteriaceae bacterium]